MFLCFFFSFCKWLSLNLFVLILQLHEVYFYFYVFIIGFCKFPLFSLFFFQSLI